MQQRWNNVRTEIGKGSERSPGRDKAIASRTPQSPHHRERAVRPVRSLPMAASANRQAEKESLGAYPSLQRYLSLIDSRGGEIIDLLCVVTNDSSNPMVALMTLVRLNKSQRKTKSHDLGKKTGRDEERLVGIGGDKRVWGQSSQNILYTRVILLVKIRQLKY